MCTVVVASHGLAGRPLVVVANRDEQLDRPARPPFVWPEVPPSGGAIAPTSAGFLAPRDELAGGTWLGLNRHGVFVGITNRFLSMRERTRRTRGEIVVEALREPSARAVHAKMRELDPRAYNGFHLVYADAADVLATASDGETLAQLVLDRGVHAVTEQSFGAGDDRARVAAIEAAWPASFDEAALAKLLASVEVHLPAMRYGTRSAMILGLAEDAAETTMRWSEGPPSTTPFVPVDLASLALRR